MGNCLLPPAPTAPAAALGFGMSLDVKDEPMLGQEEVGTALHGYCCCLSPFPMASGRNEWKKTFRALINPGASKLASLTNCPLSNTSFIHSAVGTRENHIISPRQKNTTLVPKKSSHRPAGITCRLQASWDRTDLYRSKRLCK